jgi:Fic family protein
MKRTLRLLDALKAKLDAQRPFPAAVTKNLHENLVLNWTYHSNAIEGNTLTLKETKVALEGITIGGKTLREHFEVINHSEAIVLLEELVAENQPLSEWDIKSLHQLILKNIDQENAGQYRQVNVLISGAEHKPIEAVRVQQFMQDFILWYQNSATTLHPVERAALVHSHFVKIHPFIDGNGRTARLLMNLELLKAGYPAAVIQVEQRLDYYQALDAAHCADEFEPLIQLIANSVLESFKTYFWALGMTEQVDELLKEFNG